MTKPNPSPAPAEMYEAAAGLPDGPNIAPGADALNAANTGSTNESPGGPEADSPPQVNQPNEHRLKRIRHTAYLLAEERGFQPGHEVDDWLKAENQVDAT